MDEGLVGSEAALATFDDARFHGSIEEMHDDLAPIVGETARCGGMVIVPASAHADKTDLLDYAQRAGPGTRRFILVHGEPDQQEPFRKELTARGLRSLAPARGEVIELE